jgi:pimeloyl-ACP methyl ester carboxylesterase
MASIAARAARRATSKSSMSGAVAAMIALATPTTHSGAVRIAGSLSATAAGPESHFTRDQDHFESQLARLKTPVKVVWGEKDLYINKEMGVEFAERVRAKLTLLPEIGHFPICRIQCWPSMRFVTLSDEPPAAAP